MKLLSPTSHSRLNEAAGFVLLSAGVLLLLSLVSYHAQDPSFNTSGGSASQNLIGPAGAHLADLIMQTFGLAGFTFPLLLFLLAWKWVRSEQILAPGVRLAGWTLFILCVAAGVSLGNQWTIFGGTVRAGGVVGDLLGGWLTGLLNLTGAAILTITFLVISIYLVTAFTVGLVSGWFAGPAAALRRAGERWTAWREERRRVKLEEKLEKDQRRHRRARPEPAAPAEPVTATAATPEPEAKAPWDEPVEDIPIHTLDDAASPQRPAPPPVEQPAAVEPAPARRDARLAAARPQRSEYRLPSTDLLNEPQGRAAYDSQELKEIAAKVKSKFEEFNVLGSVVQINPGPVVTTFEFKPEAGIKYSRITTLSEDLCLGLQAESILIERIPGKPTVGIEVPNSKREVIGLRQILESDEFRDSPSRLTVPLGKDINGRIKVAALDSMPHILIAGSTGSGKSVMLNAMIMSLLFRSTPEEVRMILVDPKRLELGLYEGIPHLLTPVITDPKKATNALRNAVLEMERRLRLLASQGVRNIEQFNRKVRQLQQEPRSLFEDDEETPIDDLQPLPYIIILIDELADLMMVERANVEETVTRLAQMARAVGMHLVLATQRPSVDVITGLIKANFPARISFRVATRVDSRTILDVMGAEHLLGKGDMLFLPPGSSRLIRVHGALVTEAEIGRVVDFWKQQATPEYDQSFLIAPPSEEDDAEMEEFEGEQDPLYQDAVRVVVEMGKASTSTLQRRLRLGYGRAARILDMMQRDGIIGPPDGSKPRDVLKRPDWLDEVENQYR